MRRRLRPATLAACLIWAAAPAPAQDVPPPDKSEATIQREPEVSPRFTPTRVDVDLSRRSLTRTWRAGDAIKEVPKRVTRRMLEEDRTPANPTDPGPDPLLALQRAAEAAGPDRRLSEPITLIEGDFQGANPPDTVSDVGETYVITMINSNQGARFTIYDKATGAVAAGPITLDTIGAMVDADAPCANGLGDPIVLYDSAAGRWMLSEFSQQFDRTLCVYVSASTDPVSGGWYLYQFESARDFPDYPKYAVWPDAYYMASNESSPTVYAFERAAMLQGLPARHLSFTAPELSGFGFQSLQPADLDGADPPPAGTPGLFLRHRDDEVHNPSSNDPARDLIEIFEFQTDFDTPGAASFTGPIRIAMTEIDSDLCGLTSFSCFTQPAGGPPLDPLREVLMWRVQYRNFGTHETLVGSMVTDVDGTDRGGIRWFELRRTDADWTLHQEGTYAPDDGLNRFMPSVAMDGEGNMALGYSVVAADTPAGVRYVARAADDPPGTMPQGEKTLATGTGHSASQRWGDYSSMSIDPSDDCTFWYSNQHALNGLYAVTTGAFDLDGCGAAGDTIVLERDTLLELIDALDAQAAELRRLIDMHNAITTLEGDIDALRDVVQGN
ncbi:hypothetical protein P1J78_17635 [Psychromarinibacter sp. C21-152]|uniref:Secreted protein n=1 Tax=Psychromarinibacter sediminicola TaxID=3033385 RepID=A0AAE3NVR2_9RHOB|nr:hypothetical protein [Psychromarinibacter sediminicola]MDF0602564.1 hypothetical protein [Psychromarinibacter sediminicola]